MTHSITDIPPHLAALVASEPERANDTPTLGTEDVLEALLASRARRIPCALCTVIDSGGSSPRKRGAKMLVCSTTQIVGTIGGGAIEHAVIREATRLMADGAPPEIFEQHLSHDLGMCCGGKMKVFIEPQHYSPRLFLFGAGHVAAPLCDLAASVGFEVTVVDERARWATPERFPRAQSVRAQGPMEVLDSLALSARCFAIIVTHDHGLDQEILAALLGQPLAYLGVIGSVRKRERFKKRLRAQGFDEETLTRFHTPMGLDIGAITPEEIAVSVVAEMIQLRRQGASSGAAAMRALGKGHRPKQHEAPVEGE